MAFAAPQEHLTTTGQPFTVRTAQPNDAAALLAYIRPLAEETEFFLLEADEFPVAEREERKWIQDHLDGAGRLLLLAEAEGKIIGNVSFENGSYRRIAHRGSLGIAVTKAWRRQGVGAVLLETVLQWAAASPLIEKICLEVFVSNETAIRLYKRLGFVEEGLRPRDIRRGPGCYVDTVAMYRFVK